MNAAGDELYALAEAAEAAAEAKARRQPGAVDETGRLGGDLPCRGCGYNLRGLSPAGACPECGLAVAGTLDRGLAHPTAYARELLPGCNLALAALLPGGSAWLLLLLAILMHRLGWADGEFFIRAMLLSGLMLVPIHLILGAVAATRLAAPGTVPAMPAGLWPRVVAQRSPAMAAACVGLAVLCGIVEAGPAAIGLLSAGLLAAALGCIALWRHLARAAEQVALPVLAVSARLLSWTVAAYWALLLLLWLAVVAELAGVRFGLAPNLPNPLLWFWEVLPLVVFLLWPVLAFWIALILWTLRRHLRRLLGAWSAWHD